jgi:hypothetical protein
MNIDDILDAEQLKYCYEQAYALHRHTEIPELFAREPDTVFTLPSAGDRTVGWDLIHDKFCGELYRVSPDEDSFHTGWQICTPFLWEGDTGAVKGIFPTFGFLVLSMDAETMKPPYPVLSTLELWQDRFARREDRWKIHFLQAQFMLGQYTWNWDTSEDRGLAVQKKLREIPHPVLNPERADAAAFPEQGGPGYSQDRSVFSGRGGTGADLYGIQFAQSLYTLLWQCGRMNEIPDLLFSDSDDVSVDYGEGEVCSGQDALRFYFREMKDRTSRSGGLYRVDLPASQWIRVSPDGSSAQGYWTTMSRRIERSGAKSLHRIGIGRFSNSFCKEEGVWKLKSVRWEKLQEFAPFQETPDRNLENYRRDPEGWIRDLPRLYPVSREGSQDRTEEILFLRNEILSWFHMINMGKNREEIFPSGTGQVSEEIRRLCEESRYILVTSPVLGMDGSLTEAEAFFSASLLTESGKDELTYVRGSIGMSLVKGAGGWEIRRFSWYPYASPGKWKMIQSNRPLSADSTTVV